jgi:hypothetical protein
MAITLLRVFLCLIYSLKYLSSAYCLVSTIEIEREREKEFFLKKFTTSRRKVVIYLTHVIFAIFLSLETVEIHSAVNLIS